ncbi:YdcF family protein [Tomitella cavernea]|uniref:YdcF family protein n=1 Tax=Tomitella cavernea TaxID=1387982 RepID=UPI0019052F97|nr:YdcF family protein [Tomitella cavernea]
MADDDDARSLVRFDVVRAKDKEGGASTVAIGFWAMLVLTVPLVTVTVVRQIRDDRNTTHGLMMLASAAAVWLLTVTILGTLRPDGDAAFIVFFAPVLLVTVLLMSVSLALFANTPVVVRREGLRIATLVPAAIGGAIALTLVTSIGWVFTFDRWIPLMMVLPFVMIPGALMISELVGYALYALVYGRAHRRVTEADVIVVLGAGLSGESVTPLLAGRLDKAIDVYRAIATASGSSPLIVVSGGQGADEVISEAAAMASYLSEHSEVPDDHVLLEDKSTNTEENLTNTREMLASRAVEARRIVVVTSDFHVLRSASLTQRLDMPGVIVVGSPTARYYLPSGFLREFAASVVYYRRANIAIWALFTGIWVAMMAAGLLIGAHQDYVDEPDISSHALHQARTP